MSIIQISKIQQRSGDLVDLPQLDEAELGFATDEKRLFIGKTSGTIENVEVLTSYSTISFDQIEGAEANLNVDRSLLANGQIMAYDGENWVNKGGIAGGFIDLGNVSNVKISGPAGTNYVLTTDGIGNLSWTPKGTISANIINVFSTNPAILQVDPNTPYSEGLAVTIVSVQGNNTANLNGEQFYIKLDPDYANNGNVELYENDLLTVGFDGSSLDITANTGRALTNLTSGAGTVIGNITTNSLTTTLITTGTATTPGTITGNWTLTAGSRLQSTYADLAEYYSADKNYPVGTVLDFGGEQEVTLAGIESNRIAGVVSADPAYVMNGMIQCDYPVTIALQGRVQCKVKGKVYKGDMMISAGDGFAKATIVEPKMGTVIGKALQNFDGEEGVIEVVVGRL
jgi:hypothetical protein